MNRIKHMSLSELKTLKTRIASESFARNTSIANCFSSIKSYIIKNALLQYNQSERQLYTNTFPRKVYSREMSVEWKQLSSRRTIIITDINNYTKKIERYVMKGHAPLPKKNKVSGKPTMSFNHKNNPNKDRINNIVCNAIRKQNLNNSNTRALILDGIHMRTTQFLGKIKIETNKITTVEHNKKTYREHMKNGISSIYGNLWTEVVVYKNPHAPYDVLWLDTTNTAQTVSNNISTLFKNGYISNSCVLAITVAKRGNIKGMKHTNELNIMKKTIEHVAGHEGFATNLFASRSDGRVNVVVYNIILM